MAVLLVASLIGEFAGCGAASNVPTGDAREAQGVLRVLGVEYARFAAEHDGRPPKDRQEFASFLELRKGQIVGLKEVEQLLVSPRDNEPLVIHYGKSMPPADESGSPVVAREAVGVAGKCLVANTRGGVQELAVDRLPPHLVAQ